MKYEIIRRDGSAETENVNDQDTERRENEARGLRRSLLIAGILTLPVFILEMGSHLIPPMHHWAQGVLGEQTSWYIQFVLATLVLFGPGLRFFRRPQAAYGNSLRRL